MLMTCTSWWVYEVTNSVFMLGMLGLVIFGTIFAGAIPIGVLTDSCSRSRIVQVGTAGLTLLFAALLAGFKASASLTIILLLIAIAKIFYVMILVGRPVYMKSVIPPEDTENAVTWMSLVRRVSTIVGPIVAGLIIQRTNDVLLPISIACFLMVGAFLASILLPYVRLDDASSFSLRSAKEGIHYMMKNPLVLPLSLLDTFGVMFGGATALLPVYAKDILHIGATGLGMLRAMPSVGSAIMSLYLIHRPSFRDAGVSMLLAMCMFGISTIVFGLSSIPLLSCLSLLSLGAADAVSVTVRNSVLQLKVPPKLQGRVYGVHMVFVYTSNELGEFESGMLAAAIGAIGSVVTGGVLAIAISGIFAVAFPSIRKLKAITEYAE